jgi:hypothetical protein
MTSTSLVGRLLRRCANNGAAATHHQPDGCGGSVGEKFTEQMECFAEVVLVHGNTVYTSDKDVSTIF